jgi:hypothetical protein
MWDWTIWGALIVSAVAGTGAVAVLVLRGLEAWRGFKSTRRRVLDALDEFAAKAESTADRVSTAGDTAELQASVARLRASLARFAVLREAIDEAQETFGRATALVPRK